ncbi:MAG: sigma-70 family RNA polymerase sigma factor [Phycisphaerae bacterium]|nr:sigma-70 family RNA polymerase sigma factor [Phycisphaerae bacterium]
MAENLDVILASAAAGDGEAWRELVDAYSGRVYGLVYRQCGNRELADEITQATFVKVVRKLPEYQEQGRFDAWIFRIAINALRDEMRRRGRQAIVVDFDSTPPEAFGVRDETAPSGRMEGNERLEALRSAVKNLPEADQQLIYLRYTAEMSFAQIAETLEQPLGTVLARGHRALKKLHKLMADENAA